MKVFRALKTLWSKLPRPLARGLLGFAEIATVLSVLGLVVYWLLYLVLIMVLDGMVPGGCKPTVLQRVSSVSGFDFEVEITDCWTVVETAVYVSKPGQSKKTLLFLYSPLYDPTITSVDARTVRISTDQVSDIYCRADKWQGLTIEYDVRESRTSRYRVEPRECKAK